MQVSDVRLSLLLSEEESRLGAALMRSKSADQLKSDAEADEVGRSAVQLKVEADCWLSGSHSSDADLCHCSCTSGEWGGQRVSACREPLGKGGWKSSRSLPHVHRTEAIRCRVAVRRVTALGAWL